MTHLKVLAKCLTKKKKKTEMLICKRSTWCDFCLFLWPHPLTHYVPDTLHIFPLFEHTLSCFHNFVLDDPSAWNISPLFSSQHVVSFHLSSLSFKVIAPEKTYWPCPAKAFHPLNTIYCLIPLHLLRAQITYQNSLIALFLRYLFPL